MPELSEEIAAPLDDEEYHVLLATHSHMRDREMKFFQRMVWKCFCLRGDIVADSGCVDLQGEFWRVRYIGRGEKTGEIFIFGNAFHCAGPLFQLPRYGLDSSSVGMHRAEGLSPRLSVFASTEVAGKCLTMPLTWPTEDEADMSGEEWAIVRMLH